MQGFIRQSRPSPKFLAFTCSPAVGSHIAKESLTQHGTDYSCLSSPWCITVAWPRQHLHIRWSYTFTTLRYIPGCELDDHVCVGYQTQTLVHDCWLACFEADAIIRVETKSIGALLRIINTRLIENGLCLQDYQGLLPASLPDAPQHAVLQLRRMPLKKLQLPNPSVAAPGSRLVRP